MSRESIVLSVVAVFFLTVSAVNGRIAQASIIDNELVGDPMVDCEETMISVTFKTKKPFNGRVYVQGMADDDRCSRNFAANSDQSKFSMMIQNGDCTMQRQRVTGSLEGMMLSLTIVVSFHGTFVTKSDRAYRCMCFFRNIKHLTNAIDMNLIGTTELLDTAKTPGCVYSIHTQSPDGPPLALGKVGDKIFHVWQCDDQTHGFLVHSCSVDDGKGSKFDLLDVDGCAIDPIIQPDVIYDDLKNRASVETFGYKFSDTTILNYQCTIELCKKSAGECDGLSPPICGRQKRQTRRRRDENVSEQMDLLTTLKILDNIYDSGNVSPKLPQSNSIFTNDTLNDRQNSSVKTQNSVELLSALAQHFIRSNQRVSPSATDEDNDDALELFLPVNSMARDCMRSMVVAFSAALLIAVLFVTAAAFVVLRRESLKHLI